VKQGRGDDYILSSLTSSNSGWHKGWFYLWNDSELALPTFTGNSIGQSRRTWTDDPTKTEQERMLKDHWAVLGRLRGARVTLSTVIGQNHARGVVPLRRRPLCLYEMMTDRAPWKGTVTAPTLSSPLEIQRHAAQAIGKASYSWPPARLLPMLPHEGTERLVSRCLLRRVFVDLGFYRDAGCKTPDFHRKSESLYHRDSPWISGYRVQNVSQIDTQSHTLHHIKVIVQEFITSPLWSTTIQASWLNQSENSTQR
jgi:hypothetical protein